LQYPTQIIKTVVNNFKNQYPEIEQIPAGIEPPPETETGDLAVALPMRAAGALQRSPREIATELSEMLKQRSELKSVEVAGPGFVNCTFTDSFLLKSVAKIIEQQTVEFPEPGSNKRVLIEFVSANPTGPLHVGHGRGAIYGDVLARLFEVFGYQVEREYYVNDGGSQIERLAESMLLRSRQAEGEAVELSEDHYRGDYLKEIVADSGISPGDSIETVARRGKEEIIAWIFSTLERFRINFDNTVYESEVAPPEAVGELVKRLEAEGLVRREDGATYLSTSKLGDDKDRVLIRSNGEPTYFANDLVYHLDKYNRGADQFIDIWGHDHHGYQQRLRSGLQALGCATERLEIELYQLVDLYRGGEPLQMSTRRGEFVTLDELIDEVGVDAVRFNFLTKNHNSPLDFDIEVATSQSEDNPVYYVQYAHTRLAGILRKADGQFDDVEPEDSLSEAGHRLVFKALGFVPFLQQTLAGREPHRITFWLRELARHFHTYYTAHRVVDPSAPAISARRLELVKFLKIIFKTGLDLLDVNAPERM